MIGAAWMAKPRNRHQALATTWRRTGTRRGASSSTSDGWRPGIMAFAPRPAAIVAAAITPKAASGDRDARRTGRARRSPPPTAPSTGSA